MTQSGDSVLVIAEVGSVHDGSFGNAVKLIELAAACGADAVKFQTHIAAAETLRDAPMPPYFKGEPRFEYFERTGFSLDQWKGLKAASVQAGVEFISSPFSNAAVELLEAVGVDRYKIPSGEVTNLPMLDAIGKTGKQVLLSSGMSNWAELDAAVAAIRKYHDNIVVLQCTSEYPCPDTRVGLNVIGEMMARWKLPAGYSDHTLDNHAAFAAVALGASMVEKHLTFSRRMYGSDALNAAEPAQFADLVKGIRAVSIMRGTPVNKDDLAAFADMKQIFEKSIISTCDIPAGAVITLDMVAMKKPGNGLPAARLGDVVGSVARRNIAVDRLISEDDIQYPA
ncbi:MAG TPA: N-acetylneuraminate synthase family protein [Xanthobacteraceae bacterium]|nr:N-acetylneuraminate synthase family protein [Xanthobacteraceae bacterium]